MRRESALTDWWIPLVAALAVAAGLTLTGCGDEPTPMQQALRGVHKSPRSSEAYMALGKAYTEEGLHNDAYVAYKKAYELAPNDLEVICELAETDLRLLNAEHAIKVAQAGLKIDPRHARCHEVLGKGHMMKGDPDTAISHFEQALEYDPSFVDASVDLAYAYADKGNLDKSIATAKETVARFPDQARAHYAYADIVYVTGGDWKLATEHLRKAIKLDPEHHRAMLRLASILVQKQQDYDEARDLAQKSGELYPGNGDAQSLAGWALFKTGKSDEGLQEMYMAAEGHPFNHTLWLRLSLALKEAGQEEGAKQAFQMAIRVAPRPHTTDEQKRMLREKLGSGDKRPVSVDVGTTGAKPSGEKPAANPAPDQP